MSFKPIKTLLCNLNYEKLLHFSIFNFYRGMFTLQFINLSDPILEEEEIGYKIFGYNTLSARTQVISILKGD